MEQAISNAPATVDTAAANVATQSVEFAPAIVRIGDIGTKTERKVALVNEASQTARLYAATFKNKVGTAARATLGRDAVTRAGYQAACGNFKPAAEIVALITGEACVIVGSRRVSARDAFRALPGHLEARMLTLKDQGFRTSKKTGLIEPSVQRKAYKEAIDAVEAMLDAMELTIAAQESAQ